MRVAPVLLASRSLRSLKPSSTLGLRQQSLERGEARRKRFKARVTTPEYVTGQKVLGALRYMVEAEDHPVRGLEDDGEGPQLTVVLNKAPSSRGGRRELEHKFRAAGVRRHIVIPEDEQLATMLDSGTYTLPALRKATRLPVKRFGALVTERLV
jgi:hypothetical protein